MKNLDKEKNLLQTLNKKLKKVIKQFKALINKFKMFKKKKMHMAKKLLLQILNIFSLWNKLNLKVI